MEMTWLMERELMTGLGQCPQQGPGAAALVRASGDEAPEAESFEAFAHLKKAQKAVQGG